jgi:branched-chain amino acid transport system ATP-binding protein
MAIDRPLKAAVPDRLHERPAMSPSAAVTRRPAAASASASACPSAPAGDFILQAEGLHTHYGQSHVLHGVSLAIRRGEAVGLLGRNGMGKTTLIRTLIGQLRASAGQLRVAGQDMSGQPTERIVRLGIGYVPEGRGVFPNLTVRENLLMAARPGLRGQCDWTFDRVMATFPRLSERLNNGGAQLSGGEQQMLAIGRALMAKPRVLLLDEPSMGLAPIIVQDIFRTLKRINEEGLTIFLVEQNVKQALKIAHRAYVLENGRIVLHGSGAELLTEPRVQEAYLGS